MRRIILDSNVIITDPSTGSFTVPDSKFVVPAEVASELLAAPPGTTSSYFSLVSKMVNSGNTEVVSSQQTTPTFQWSPEQPGIRLSQVDQAVLTVANETKQAHPQDEVLIASDDHHIRVAGSRMGLKVLSSTELAALLQGGHQDATVKEQAKKVLSYERKHLIWSALFGALATAGVTLVVQNIQAILGTAHMGYRYLSPCCWNHALLGSG